MKYNVTIKSIEEASERLNGIAKNTPLQKNKRLSALYNAHIYFKREDLQPVRSYKIRGAFNLMSSLSDEEKKRGVVCASAGNHAQGVAFSCSYLKIKGTIFMPTIAPLQKIDRVKHFGGKWIEIKLVGQSFDESTIAGQYYCKEKGGIFVHAFNDERVISGQGTIGKEIHEELGDSIDYIVCPIGGGGLISGIGTYMKSKIPRVKIIGVEPKGAPSMYESIKADRVVTLDEIDTFVDGAAIKTVGGITFEIAKTVVDDILLSDEGKVSTTMIELYQNEGIVAEPAGALSISVLDVLAKKIRGKTVVCILSGGNNDILRYPEILEKSLVYQELKHYFLIEFAQKPRQLRLLVDKALGPTDDIVRFEYIKKTSKEHGPALLGIELTDKRHLQRLLNKMDRLQIRYTKITSDDPLYSYLI